MEKSAVAGGAGFLGSHCSTDPGNLGSDLTVLAKPQEEPQQSELSSRDWREPETVMSPMSPSDFGLEPNLFGLGSDLAVVARREFVAKGPLYLPLKRFLDIVGGLVGLVLLSPVIFVVAAMAKLIDVGPALYRHSRVGLNGQQFTCYKFRTMVLNADKMKCDIARRNHHNDDRTFKVPSDPRVTPFGKWLRRTSIDEIPQLWNVVKGDMSLVGPRPPIPEEVERYTLADKRRFLVKPGMTCIWQVSGRSELAFPIQVRLDLLYIEQRSLWLDLKLILLTIPAVLTARGAY